jgi:hypothetical protein
MGSPAGDCLVLSDVGAWTGTSLADEGSVAWGASVGGAGAAGAVASGGGAGAAGAVASVGGACSAGVGSGCCGVDPWTCSPRGRCTGTVRPEASTEPPAKTMASPTPHPSIFDPLIQ